MKRYWFWKIVDWLIITAACAMGVLVAIAKGIDPWWLALTWLFLVVLSRIQILFMQRFIDRNIKF